MQGVSLGFGGPLLLEGVDLTLDRGERVCLVGRNGSGKTTLMKLIAGELAPDGGELVFQQGARAARLAQEALPDQDGTVFDMVTGGLGDIGEMLARYHNASHELALEHGDAALKELERAQHALEAMGGWSSHQRVEAVLSRMQLEPDVEFADLSGGLKRRVMLAKALVSEPDVLLLDEPTNHLDIEAIVWLEEFLLGFGGALMFITHDRAFLKRLATRIVELDRGRLTNWPFDYPTYVRRKEASQHTEARHQAAFEKTLAQEEAWIRQGIRARRTRNEGRVRALEAMREAHRERRRHTGNVSMTMSEAERSGKLVLEARDVSFSFDDRPLIRDFSTVVLRGDKVGIIGKNGVGKTTLLRILLGQVEPERGSVHHGTRLTVGYFDQHRAQLNDDASVRDNVAEGSDFVEIDGERRHVISYLGNFLFSPERMRSPVRALSGGERNRLLLARLFTKPCNVLVLDEPTNDLDVETLDLLEELLIDYRGTVLLVSHDREFLNNVVTSTLVFEGDGRVKEYVGGYDDWLKQRGPVGDARAPANAPKPVMRQSSPPRREATRKLSYKEKRELEALPQRIEELEEARERLHNELADPELYRRGGETVVSKKTNLNALEKELETAYQRWESLEAVSTPALKS